MRAKALTIAFIIAFVLGMTATIWNPITRAYDNLTTSWETATHQGMPACEDEDSPGPCHWDAAHRGNGQGRSFTIFADGSIEYDDAAHPMTAQECDEQGLDSALCDAIAEGEE